MNDIELLVKRGIIATQTGSLQEGEQLLRAAVAMDPDNEDAWFWLSAAVDDLEERKACLRRVLEINVNNEEAWRRLQSLVLTPARHLAPDDDNAEAAQATSRGGQEFPCPSCQGDLAYSPGDDALACPHCGRIVEIAETGEAPESRSLLNMPATREGQEEWVGLQIYRCQDCGATTTISARRGSLECPFCGSSYLVKPPQGVSLIPPQAIIPFRLTEDEAREALKRWLREGSWLRPGKLPKQAVIWRLHGVYVPLWLFDGMVRIQQRDEEGNIQIRHDLVRHVPVGASLSPSPQTMDELAPFDFARLRAFQPEYMAGWEAEVYQIALADAAIQVRKPIRRAIEAMVGAVEQVNFSEEGWLLAMAPVFVGAYRFEDRPYLFAVNGQTGKVYAEMPRSNERTALLVAGGVALVAMALLLIVLMILQAQALR